MKIATLLTASVLLLTAAADAQNSAALKRELREKERAAGNDATKLIELAEWAEDNGLVADRRRLLQEVLKIDPENAQAHQLLGFVKFDGQWVTKAKADVLRREKVEKEMKERGWVEVDGVWVAKEEEADAKQGIYRHDGEVVSRSEKMALNEGKVRHPKTGEFIPAEDAAKAEQGMFPIEGGARWVDLAEADRWHAEPGRPWIFRSYHAWILSSKPLAEIEKLAPDLDSGIDSAARVFTGEMPRPAHRPVVWIALGPEQYTALGNEVGAEGSAHAVFRAEADMTVDGLGTVRPIIMNWATDWGPYWIRHAGGFAYVHAMTTAEGIEVPLWFQRGVAGYAERFHSPGVAAWFGKQHLQKGGVKDLASWFSGFEISGDLQPSQIDFNVYQAGLVLDFAMSGRDKDSTAALKEVTDAVVARQAKPAAAACAKLQKAVVAAEDGLRNFLKETTEKN